MIEAIVMIKLRKIIQCIIIIVFLISHTGQAYALRPVALSNTAKKIPLENNLTYPASFIGTEKERQSEVIKAVKNLFEELLSIPDRSGTIWSRITAQVDITIKLSGYSITLSNGDIITEFHIYGEREWPTFYIPSEDCYVTITMGENPVAYEHYQNLFYLLNGNEIELNESAGAGFPLKLDQEWDDWDTKNNRLFSDKYSPYETVIDKFVAKYVLIALRELLLQYSGRTINIFDLFGGAGRLISNIDKSIKMNPSLYTRNTERIKYFLGERNEISADRAKKRLKDVNVDVHNIDLLECGNLQDEMNAKADIIIFEGALTRQVIGNKEDAVYMIKEAYEALQPGGFCILAGFTGIWLKSYDFEDAGFDILNMSIPHNTLKDISGKQFYILQKPTPKTNMQTMVPSSATATTAPYSYPSDKVRAFIQSAV